MKKLIYLFLTVLIVACSSDDNNNDGDNNNNNNSNCDYVPNTLPVTNAIADRATFNGIISLDGNCEFPITEQGFVYSTEVQPTIEDAKINVNGTDVTTTIENLEPNITYYVRTFLTNALGEFYGNEVSFILICDVVYLADNGITIKACGDANVGDTGVINGVTYTVVDDAMLRQMAENEQDVTKAVTTRVTDMSEMFLSATSFNQDISSWDVSSVTNMSAMFAETSFNQPIGNWNVSNVTTIDSMFLLATAFNQNLSSWDVSNVTDMSSMFNSAIVFNQDLSAWSVDEVIDCAGFSTNTPSWTLPKPNFTNCNP